MIHINLLKISFYRTSFLVTIFDKYGDIYTNVLIFTNSLENFLQPNDCKQKPPINNFGGLAIPQGGIHDFASPPRDRFAFSIHNYYSPSAEKNKKWKG